VVLSGAVGWGILRGQAGPGESIALDHGTAVSEEHDAATVAPGAAIYVHVLGEVASPGLYLLAPRARLVDALAAAGGTLDTADLQAVNLARPLSDGEQIVVPEIGASPAPGKSGAGGAGTDAADADGQVNLNTADRAALETLPRIGPALAERIIDWREENGRFRSVDDLLAVPGIGEKLLAGVREKVRV